MTGVSLFLNPQQDVRMGGRQSNATYQYTLKSDNAADLKTWARKLSDALDGRPALTDVNTDQQDNGVETFVTIDRDTAARLGVAAKDVDNALYDHFGQRQAATIYEDLNQYSVVMEAARPYTTGPEALNDVYVPAAALVRLRSPRATSSWRPVDRQQRRPGQHLAARERADQTAPPANPSLRDPSTGSALSTSVRRMIPLTAIASFSERAVPASVNHQDTELATTVSFNLADGYSLSDAQTTIAQAEADIGMPNNVRGSFQGTAQSFQASLQAGADADRRPRSSPSTLCWACSTKAYACIRSPCALDPALSGRRRCARADDLQDVEFSIIALIGVFLLIGIVKKNAILIIDFALEAERSRDLSSTDAAREAMPAAVSGRS